VEWSEKMKMKPSVLGLIVVVMMFGGIWLTDLMGKWNTGTSKEPSLIMTGDSAGKPNPADIRGSYSFGDINIGYGVSLIDLKTAFRLPAETEAATFQVKGLESLYSTEFTSGKEIGADSVRYFVALYAGLPFNVAADIWMPVDAVNLLKQRGNLTAEQIKYLEAHSVGTAQENAPISTNVANTTPSGSKTEPSAVDKKVTGSTTFQQLLDWGVPQATIESIVGGTMPGPASAVKDYITQKGLEFMTYKQSLQAEVDKHK
jgi:hypothetical protein